MKKRTGIFAAVLAAVMLLSLSVSAVSMTPNLEWKEAPELECEESARGGEAAALIYNKLGKETLAVPEDACTITPYSAAAEAEEDIKLSLEAAYEELKEEDKLLLLAPNLKELLPEIAEAYGLRELKAEELLCRDLFDLDFLPQYAKRVAGSNTMTMCFETDLNPDTVLVVLQRVEDEHWEALAPEEVERLEDGEVRLTLRSLSPVAFLVPSGEGQLRDSIAQKGAPEIALEKDDVVAIIRNEDGEEVLDIPETALTVSTLMEIEKAEPAVQELLESAYARFMETENLSAAVEDLDEEKLEEIAEAFKLRSLRAEDLIVRDLFDLSLEKEYADKLAEDDNNVRLTFCLDMKEDELLLVLCYDSEDGEWELIDLEDVEFFENGDVAVTFEELGPIALVVLSE